MKNVKTLFNCIVILLAVGILISCGKGEKIQLQLKLKEGSSYEIKAGADQKISQTIQGQKMDMLQKTTMEYTFAVEKVEPNGNATAKISYNSIKFEQDGPGGKIEYDSSNPPAKIPPAAAGFAALKEGTFTVILSPEGRVVDMKGIDKMLDLVIEKLDLPDEATRIQAKENAQNFFGEQVMKEMMESMMAIYPEKPVGVGDTWSKVVLVSKGFPMILTNNFTLKKRKNGIATVEIKSSVQPYPEAAPMEMGPIKLKYELSGTQEGTMELEEATGWSKRATIKQNFTGTVHIEGAPQMSGMSFPMTVEGTITLE
ncbi:MAG: hypothetical protein A2Y62_21365 [Candidatus Fischerbacteria bacterium RBG_13_37_8]|uniref:Uncharacterized protein n=1 Tax=Candidatus Fischerbacteria bacterium RBG_13_37_8 TaxID=1817863 RepID=A0A1F5VTB7_9BACT|nr:MAG: hypothetical protein A2Y62_21365 [Candidatus Fischerbacteria bacterium RBG_13_37_8]